MKGIRNIIFDLGGVIIDLDIPRSIGQLDEMGAGRVKEYFGLGYASSFFKDHESGKITDDEFVTDLQKLVGNGHTREEVIAGWNAMLIGFPPERIALLEQLRTKYRLFLFSNTNGLHYAAFHKIFSDHFGGRSLDSLFEKAYYSHLIRHRKPDVEAFRYVVNDSGLDPSETLFIDDAKVNVEGAEKAGLQGLYLEPGKTILDLGL